MDLPRGHPDFIPHGTVSSEPGCNRIRSGVYLGGMATGATRTVNTIDGDDAFWQSAYRSHGSAVLSFLLRRVGRRSEAEDQLR